MDNLTENITYKRLEDQIDWYDKKSNSHQKAFKQLKLSSIVIAACIPIASLYFMPQVTAIMGVLMVIIEGLQSLNQHHDLWFTYRSTCESLKHEKYTYLALAGPYSDEESPQQILAERLEKTISQEHARWVDTIKKCDVPKTQHQIREKN